MPQGKGGKGKGKGPKKGTGGGPKQPRKAEQILKEQQLTPQERADAVRPLWESLSQDQRVQLLSVPITVLREKATQLYEVAKQQAGSDAAADTELEFGALEGTIDEVLDAGVERLKERTTWKLWTWPAEETEFTDAEAFRGFVTDKHVREELRKYLPRDDPKTPERPAEEGFRKRMTDLLGRVQAINQRQMEEAAKAQGQGSKGRGNKGQGQQADGAGQKGGKQDKGSADANGDAAHGKDSKDGKSSQTGQQQKEGGAAADGDALPNGQHDAGKDKDKEKEKEKDSKEGEGSTFQGIYKRRRHHAADATMAARDTNVELINIMLEALEREHEALYATLILPVTHYVMEALPEDQRETTKGDLAFEDLDRLMPDDAAHIVEWLTEKVDALSSKLKAEPRDEEEAEDEENMGDVDLWELADGGNSLTVNKKWLQHLQDRLLGEDGHPRKVRAGEDPHHCGLVLEWVYGSIVSTAEKARDGAHRNLGSYIPSVADSHHSLMRVLEEQAIWESRLKQAKDLMAEMLKSRLEASELAKQHDIRPAQPKKVEDAAGSSALSATPAGADDGLPDSVIISMLRRETLLTRAKLHVLLFEHLQQDRQLRTWRMQLKQGEPEFERLKRELEEVKHSHRGLDGTYRSQAEMERHRAALADAAIEEQLEVQTAFREQGALLQSVYDAKQRAEYEMSKRENEVKQLQGWKGTVEGLLDKFVELVNARQGGEGADANGTSPTAAADKDMALDDATLLDRPSEGDVEAGTANSSAGGLTPHQYIQLTKLRAHFHKDVRKQLYGDADDKVFFEGLKSEVRSIEKRMEEARVVIQHMELSLLNVACDDPGITVGAQLVLPVLQERLDSRAQEFAAERAKMAESEIIRMLAEAAEREAAEKEKKRAAKAVKKDKLKSEKEKERLERLAKEQAEAERRKAEEEARAAAEEEERRKRFEALEALRKEEEEMMEKRRQELLSDENGYWRMRMRMEEERAAAEAEALALSREAELAAAAAAATGNAEEHGRSQKDKSGRDAAQHVYANGGPHHNSVQAQRDRRQGQGSERQGRDRDRVPSSPAHAERHGQQPVNSRVRDARSNSRTRSSQQQEAAARAPAAATAGVQASPAPAPAQTAAPAASGPVAAQGPASVAAAAAKAGSGSTTTPAQPALYFGAVPVVIPAGSPAPPAPQPPSAPSTGPGPQQEAAAPSPAPASQGAAGSAEPQVATPSPTPSAQAPAESTAPTGPQGSLGAPAPSPVQGQGQAPPLAQAASGSMAPQPAPAGTPPPPPPAHPGTPQPYGPPGVMPPLVPVPLPPGMPPPGMQMGPNGVAMGPGSPAHRGAIPPGAPGVPPMMPPVLPPGPPGMPPPLMGGAPVPPPPPPLQPPNMVILQQPNGQYFMFPANVPPPPGAVFPTAPVPPHIMHMMHQQMLAQQHAAALQQQHMQQAAAAMAGAGPRMGPPAGPGMPPHPHPIALPPPGVIPANMTVSTGPRSPHARGVQPVPTPPQPGTPQASSGGSAQPPPPAASDLSTSTAQGAPAGPAKEGSSGAADGSAGAASATAGSGPAQQTASTGGLAPTVQPPPVPSTPPSATASTTPGGSERALNVSAKPFIPGGARHTTNNSNASASGGESSSPAHHHMQQQGHMMRDPQGPGMPYPNGLMGMPQMGMVPPGPHMAGAMPMGMLPPGMPGAPGMNGGPGMGRGPAGGGNGKGGTGRQGAVPPQQRVAAMAQQHPHHQIHQMLHNQMLAAAAQAAQSGVPLDPRTAAVAGAMPHMFPLHMMGPGAPPGMLPPHMGPPPHGHGPPMPLIMPPPHGMAGHPGLHPGMGGPHQGPQQQQQQPGPQHPKVPQPPSPGGPFDTADTNSSGSSEDNSVTSAGPVSGAGDQVGSSPQQHQHQHPQQQSAQHPQALAAADGGSSGACTPLTDSTSQPGETGQGAPAVSPPVPSHTSTTPNGHLQNGSNKAVSVNGAAPKGEHATVSGAADCQPQASPAQAATIPSSTSPASSATQGAGVVAGSDAKSSASIAGRQGASTPATAQQQTTTRGQSPPPSSSSSTTVPTPSAPATAAPQQQKQHAAAETPASSSKSSSSSSINNSSATLSHSNSSVSTATSSGGNAVANGPVSSTAGTASAGSSTPSSSTPAPRSWSAIAAKERPSASGTPTTSGFVPLPSSSAASGAQANGPAPASPAAAQMQHGMSWKSKLQVGLQHQSSGAGSAGVGSPLQHSTPDHSAASSNGGAPHQQQQSSSRQQSSSSAPAAGPVVPKRAGTPAVGTFMQQAPTQPGGARLRVTDTGAVVYDMPAGTANGSANGNHHQQQQRRLNLVRGLRNGEGEYNCFLNVIIQSLWHLRPFREALLALNPSKGSAAAAGKPATAAAAVAQPLANGNHPASPVASSAAGATHPDTQVLQALCAIFTALATPPEARQQQEAAAAKDSSSAGGKAAPSLGRAVSPEVLREALDSLSGSTSTTGAPGSGSGTPSGGGMRIDKHEMHDAAEVLDQILSCLHRAELLQQGQGQQPDITLPRRARAATVTLPPGTPGHSPLSTVHRLFGLDVQVPCGESSGPTAGTSSTSSTSGGSAGDAELHRSGSARGSRAGSSSAAASSAQQLHPTPSQGSFSGATGVSSSGGASPAGHLQTASGSAPAPLPEVLQYTKFCHLVPAQGLRSAFASAAGGPAGSVSSWEDLLAAVDAAGNGVTSSNGSGGGAATGGHQAVTTLLRRPSVFTLALVWESPQVPPDSIRATLCALGPQLELPAALRTLPPAPVGLPGAVVSNGAGAHNPWPPAPRSTYALRAVVCYFGHHYLAFALSEELGMWLCFDDADISLVGGWHDVCRAMLVRRMQPSLLLYEDPLAC